MVERSLTTGVTKTALRLGGSLDGDLVLKPCDLQIPEHLEFRVGIVPIVALEEHDGARDLGVQLRHSVWVVIHGVLVG